MATADLAVKQARPLIVVVGGGIAGLAFAALAARASRGGVGAAPPRILVLERGEAPSGDSATRRRAYAHSLSLRRDVDGVGVVQRLGLEAQLRGVATPSLGFFLAQDDGGDAKPQFAFNSSWFAALGTGGHAGGIRVQRYDVWRALLEAALAECGDVVVEVRFEAELVGVVEAGGANKVTLTLRDGTRLHADLVVAADGHRSAVRAALLPTASLNFLETIIVGATLKLGESSSALPALARLQHGLLCTTRGGSSSFLSDEGDGKLLISLALPWRDAPPPASRDEAQTNAALRARVREAARNYAAPFAALFERMLEEAPYVVSCFDRLPTPPSASGRVVFVGDASHPVSPFAGAGANMALVDAAELVDELFQGGVLVEDISSATRRFFSRSEKARARVVEQQRSTIRLVHAEGTLALLARRVLFASLASVLDPKRRRRTLATLGVVVTAATIGFGAMLWRRRAVAQSSA